MSAPLLNGAYPQIGIGQRIHRYVVIETYDRNPGASTAERFMASRTTTDQLVLVDWIAVETIDRSDARRPGDGCYQVNGYVPTNLSRLPDKYQSELGRRRWPEESLHEKPAQAWSAQMQHWEHELGAANNGAAVYRAETRGGKNVVARERAAMMLRLSEEKIVERQRHADYCRAQWIAAVHAEDGERD